jgi:hypothetical protein
VPDPSGRAPRKRRPAKTDPPTTRAFRQRGVDVELREAGNRVELTLDGHPVAVTVDRGEFHSQLANQFMAFPSLDHLVDTLLANEGRTWTLHGHLCDERCRAGRHAHGPGQGAGGHAGHDHGSHAHGHDG